MQLPNKVDMTVMPNVRIHKYTTHEMMDVQLIMFLKWTYETRPLMINTHKTSTAELKSRF